jgi:hypothetical protein
MKILRSCRDSHEGTARDSADCGNHGSGASASACILQGESEASGGCNRQAVAHEKGAQDHGHNIQIQGIFREPRRKHGRSLLRAGSK